MEIFELVRTFFQNDIQCTIFAPAQVFFRWISFYFSLFSIVISHFFHWFSYIVRRFECHEVAAKHSRIWKKISSVGDTNSGHDQITSMQSMCYRWNCIWEGNSLFYTMSTRGNIFLCAKCRISIWFVVFCFLLSVVEEKK